MRVMVAHFQSKSGPTRVSDSARVGLGQPSHATMWVERRGATRVARRVTRDTLVGVACDAWRLAGRRVRGGRVEGSGVCDTLLAVTWQICDTCAIHDMTQDIR
jgi:hypothetical protein